ncbi:hypothetical protein [Pseudomonas sp. R5(2019)]|uniref:hypothetical protein n=1 Tax=Pseudomonas sp. R5(2019) TaxID=2697566 RepID=UPI001411D5AF|nr:hypothetical protein [Pseudomonas sp. R5(2019)]NBA96300.1 hypothetical protein [Pseudomonas sp. R5(2019)]
MKKELDEAHKAYARRKCKEMVEGLKRDEAHRDFVRAKCKEHHLLDLEDTGITAVIRIAIAHAPLLRDMPPERQALYVHKRVGLLVDVDPERVDNVLRFMREHCGL